MAENNIIWHWVQLLVQSQGLTVKLTYKLEDLSAHTISYISWLLALIRVFWTWWQNCNVSLSQWLCQPDNLCIHSNSHAASMWSVAYKQQKRRGWLECQNSSSQHSALLSFRASISTILTSVHLLINKNKLHLFLFIQKLHLFLSHQE